MAQQQNQHRFLLWSDRIYTPARAAQVSGHLNFRSVRTSLSQLDQWVHDGNNRIKFSKLDESQSTYFLGNFMHSATILIFRWCYQLIWSYEVSNWRLFQGKMHFFLSFSVFHDPSSGRYNFRMLLVLFVRPRSVFYHIILYTVMRNGETMERIGNNK
ncbi:hypothetical protein L208DRAFT_70677 [Tricholoma matsutake]|nr:hypothetical protein L208DRAFT_70677 [Tricholoma matsutake 945]